MAGENFKPTYDEIQQAVKVYDTTMKNDTANYDSAINDIASCMALYSAPSAEKIVEALMRVINDWIRPNINPNLAVLAKVIYADFPEIKAAREFSIQSLNKTSNSDLYKRYESLTLKLFQDLDNVQGIGGSSAGICLHLLAPSFFPSWNSDIVEAYWDIDQIQMNKEVYWAFMLEVKKRIEAAYSSHSVEPDVLRRIDKFNYCRIHHLM